MVPPATMLSYVLQWKKVVKVEKNTCKVRQEKIRRTLQNRTFLSSLSITARSHRPLVTVLLVQIRRYGQGAPGQEPDEIVPHDGPHRVQVLVPPYGMRQRVYIDGVRFGIDGALPVDAYPETFREKVQIRPRSYQYHDERHAMLNLFAVFRRQRHRLRGVAVAYERVLG